VVPAHLELRVDDGNGLVEGNEENHGKEDDREERDEQWVEYFPRNVYLAHRKAPQHFFLCS